jgi:tight adherence protein B
MTADAVGHGLDLETVAMLIAAGMALTFIALCVVFSGFLAERRLRDRLEDMETRALTGSRSLQMATLRRVERAGSLPTLDRSCGAGSPTAARSANGPDLGMNLTLGDYAFNSIAIAAAMAFLLYLVLDMAPGVRSPARCRSASACPTCGSAGGEEARPAVQPAVSHDA